MAEARALFEAPAVVDAASLSLAWTAPDEAGLRAFLMSAFLFLDPRVSLLQAGLRAFLIERHSFFEQLALY